MRSDDAEHLMQQLRQMHHIYEQAYLTIIAAAGADADYGIPGVSRSRKVKQAHVQIGEATLLDALPDSRDDLRECSWSTRAWTLQEGALSRRRLMFTDQQVHFECLRMRCQESVYDSTSFSQDLDEAITTSMGSRKGRDFHRCFPAGTFGDHEGHDEFIAGYVNDYAQRDLTYESDALIAFTGMMKKYAETTNYRFHWGMPYILLPAGTRHDPNAFMDTIMDMNKIQIGKRQRRQEFPSWSWAGWRGACIGYQVPRRSMSRYGASVSVELIDGTTVPWIDYANCAAKSPSSPYLQIRGCSGKVTITKRNLTDEDFDAELNGRNKPNVFKLHMWQPWPAQEDEKMIGKKLQVIFLGTERGLPLSGPTELLLLEAHEGYYEIIGTGSIDPESLLTNHISWPSHEIFRVG